MTIKHLQHDWWMALVVPIPLHVATPVLKPGAPVTDKEARDAVGRCLADGSACYPDKDAPEAKVMDGKSALAPFGRLD